MTGHVPEIFARLLELHRRLEEAGLDHAVGGALALAYHVRDPRGTSGIDLNITADIHHPEIVLEAMPPQVTVHETAAGELGSEGQTRLWWDAAPDRTPVDLFLPVHPVYHQLVVSRAEPRDIFGTTIKVLQATDLMVFKMLFNRTKDWADIEALLDCGTGDPDEAAGWVETFLGPDDPRLSRLAEFRSQY